MLPPESRDEHSPPLRVLINHRPPAPQVGHVNQIVGDELSPTQFSYFGGYRSPEIFKDTYLKPGVDVVHVPDLARLLGDTVSEDERVTKVESFIRALEERSLPLVQSILSPRRVLSPEQKLLDSATSVFVVLDEVTQSPNKSHTTLIPHGHFRERFDGYPRAEPVRGKLLCIGRNRLDTSAWGPLKVLPVTDTPGLALRLAGEVSAETEALIERTARRTQNAVTWRGDPLSDAEILREVSGSELVILLEIESMDDITLLFLVLSADRPVLAPYSITLQALASEVGPGWVTTYEGPLTAELLDEKIAEARSSRISAQPAFRGRGVADTVTAYRDAFRMAAETS